MSYSCRIYFINKANKGRNRQGNIWFSKKSPLLKHYQIFMDGGCLPQDYLKQTMAFNCDFIHIKAENQNFPQNAIYFAQLLEKMFLCSDIY